MEQAFKVTSESKGWLSPLPLSPGERKIGRGKGDSSIAERTHRRHSQLRAGGGRSLWGKWLRVGTSACLPPRAHASLDTDGVRVVGPRLRARWLYEEAAGRQAPGIRGMKAWAVRTFSGRSPAWTYPVTEDSQCSCWNVSWHCWCRSDSPWYRQTSW